MSADGSGQIRRTNDPASDTNPRWSPDWSRIAFDSTRSPPGIHIMNQDGSSPTFVTSGQCPEWLPSGQRIAFARSGVGSGCPGSPIVDILTAKTDGTDQVNLTNQDCYGSNSVPAWSPDGTRLAFHVACTDFSFNWCSYAEILIRRVDGSQSTWLARNGCCLDTGTAIRNVAPDWQTLPTNGYPRPKGATPISAPLVPAYTQCTAPNRTHGPALAFPSCSPPQKAEHVAHRGHCGLERPADQVHRLAHV